MQNLTPAITMSPFKGIRRYIAFHMSVGEMICRWSFIKLVLLITG